MSSNDTQDFLKNNPHIKLDEWTDEKIAVPKIKFDPESKKITRSYELETVKTKYLNIPKVKHRCKTGEHDFEVVDVHRCIFSCLKCSFSKLAHPAFYKFKDKKLVNLRTNKAV